MIGSGRFLAISVKHRIGKIWLSLPIRVPMFGLMKNSALIFFNYTQMPCFLIVWKMNSFMQRCLIIPVHLHAVSAAPRTRSELRKQYGKNVYCAGNYWVLYTVWGQALCTYMYMQSPFIDFRDGRFTDGLINWLRVAAKDFRKEISSLHVSGQQQIPSASI